MQEAEKIPAAESTPVAAPEKKPRKRRFRFACLFIVIAILLVCTGVFAVLWLAGFVQKYSCSAVVEDSQIWRSLECERYVTEEVGDGEYRYQQNAGDSGIETDQEKIITSVVQKASPSVVGIGITGDSSNENQVIGTGFIVTSNGLIVTNRHVVEQEGSDYFVNLKDSDEPIPVIEIYRDPVNDIALITIEREDLTALPLGDSSTLAQGQTVVAIGNPLGKYSGTVTTGIISGLNREVQISEGFFSASVETYEDVIQTDAAINPGNSGGPLLNSDAEVIGMNFATVSGADNLSFAIPINRVKSRIEELNEFGRFRIPYIGIEYRLRIVFIDGESTVGAQILRVYEGSPAASAGIRKDDVIVEFNAQDLQDESLFSLIQKTAIGDRVKSVLLRGGESFETTITIGERR